MPRKNLLSLHESIAIALLSFPNRSGTFSEIADFITKRNLSEIRNGNIPLAEQVMLRSIQSKGRYNYLFEAAGNDRIRLRNLTP